MFILKKLAFSSYLFYQKQGRIDKVTSEISVPRVLCESYKLLYIGVLHNFYGYQRLPSAEY